jgi:hypothetical protein
MDILYSWYNHSTERWECDQKEVLNNLRLKGVRCSNVEYHHLRSKKATTKLYSKLTDKKKPKVFID